MKSHRLISKRKKIEKSQQKGRKGKGRTKILPLKKRMKPVERVIYIYIKIGITINLKHLSKEHNQLLVVLLRKNARK